MYSKFWRELTDLGLWKDSRYIEKKNRIGDGRGEWIVRNHNELMSKCVLNHMMSLYPNPTGKDY